MSSISSSSTYSVSSSYSTNKGLSGLVSGMDTDTLVEQMLSGTQSKIDKVEGERQQLLWKQEMYREIITSINSFHNSFFNSSFDASSANNLASADFFNSMVSTVTSGSNALKILSSSSDASVGDMDVIVEQLASSAKIQGSQGKLSNDSIVGVIPNADQIETLFQSKTVTFEANGQSITVDLAGITSQDDLVSTLNSQLSSIGASVKVEDDKLAILSNANTSVTVSGSEWGLKTLGFSQETTSSYNPNVGAQILSASTQPDFTTGINFEITFNGTAHQIYVDPKAGPNGEITPDAIKAALAESIAKEFGGTAAADGTVTGGYIDLQYDVQDDGTVAFVLGTTQDNQFSITGADAQALGIQPGASSRISTSSKLSELNGVVGDSFTFTINGKEFSFSGDDTLGSMINTINSSGVGVTVSYSSLSDTFLIQSTNTGSKYGIDVSQQEGNLLSVLIGKDQNGDDILSAGSSVSSKPLTTKLIEGSGAPDLNAALGSEVSFSINVNGEDHTFSVSAVAGTQLTADQAIEEINKQLAKKFKDETSGNPTIFINAETGNLEVTDDSVVKFKQTSASLGNSSQASSAKQKDLALFLGFNVTEKSNIATADTDISELSEASRLAVSSLATSGKLGDISAQGISFADGRLVATKDAKDILKNNEDLQTFFGMENVDFDDPNADNAFEKIFGDGTLAADAVQGGTDAIVTINGIQVVRNSNTFTVDGVTMQVTKVSDKDSNGNAIASTISTSRDVDSIVETVKNFVDEYNKLIETLNGYVDEEASYRDYAPLTDAQKKEMSERQIELWEEKAKEGLLRNDSDIEYFLNAMRTALYTKPASSKFALYNIGIETGEWEEQGKLHFDEAAFREALSSDPESVKNLFTDPENGLAVQLETIMDNTANLSSANPGTLVSLAGMDGYISDDTSTISRELKDLEERIETLKTRYEAERQKYWDQFNNMEVILSNYSTQAGWLAQQFAY